jgi:hypothetical protein
MIEREPVDRMFHEKSQPFPGLRGGMTIRPGKG